MARLHPFHLVPALLAAASQAGEITIETRPFAVEIAFNASAMPADERVLLDLPAKRCEEFPIARIAAHGSKHSKGDELIRFDRAGLERQIADLRHALEAKVAGLAQAEIELEHLKQTGPHKLEALRRSAEIAKEENEYFIKTGRQASEESATRSLKTSEQLLANQREELKQLTKMYEADDLTEDTEEIILERQQEEVAAAEFSLRMEVLNHRRTLDVLLPREAQVLADRQRDSSINFLKAETEAPRVLELKTLGVRALKTAVERDREELADLESDLALLDFKAPADGWFYHGAMRDGRWNPAEFSSSLVVNGLAPIGQPFATFIPANAPLSLVAFVDETMARSLSPGLSAGVTIPGREDWDITAKISTIAPTPTLAESYRVDLSVTWPVDCFPVPGTTASVRTISYEKPAAIVIPNKSLTYSSMGWSVDIKLADGKTERRPVRRGRIAAGETEILSGLEPGQVIVVR